LTQGERDTFLSIGEEKGRGNDIREGKKKNRSMEQGQKKGFIKKIASQYST